MLFSSQNYEVFRPQRPNYGMTPCRFDLPEDLSKKPPMKRPKPKYQVFISSTQEDLRVEREAIIREILKFHHIPIGMEAFTATDDRGWQTILPLIDVTDYYVLIIAGRYGSIDQEKGKSWTQLEYEYAIERKIPVLAFIRHREEIRISQTDQGDGAPEKQEKLLDFIRLVGLKHQTVKWRTTEELAKEVGAALTNHIRRDEDSDNPRPGWYRGDSMLFSANAVEEITRLSAENANLKQDLETIRSSHGLNDKAAEIHRIVEYLRQSELVNNKNLYDSFLMLAPMLSMGVQLFEISQHLSAYCGLDWPRVRDNLAATVCSKLRIANLIRFETRQEGTDQFRRTEKTYYLTDLGASVAFHAQVGKPSVSR